MSPHFSFDYLLQHPATFFLPGCPSLFLCSDDPVYSTAPSQSYPGAGRDFAPAIRL